MDYIYAYICIHNIHINNKKQTKMFANLKRKADNDTESPDQLDQAPVAKKRITGEKTVKKVEKKMNFFSKWNAGRFNRIIFNIISQI